MSVEREDAENLVLYRIKVLEEAVKFNVGRNDNLRENMADLRQDIANVRRDYVSREEMKNEHGETRAEKMLWILGVGTFGTMILSVVSIIHQFT